MQNCFKIDLGSIKLSNVWFHVWKPELFWWLSWNGAYLGVGSRTTKESNNDSQQVTRGHNKSKRSRNESKLIYKDSQWVKTDIQGVTTSQKRPAMTHKESQRVKNLTLTVNFHWLRWIYSLLRSHHRNYGEHKAPVKRSKLFTQQHTTFVYHLLHVVACCCLGQWSNASNILRNIVQLYNLLWIVRLKYICSPRNH